MEYIVGFLFVLGLVVYGLGWKYTVIWLLLCALAGALIIPGFYKGGCDGGLCATWILLMPFVWLGIGLVLLLIRFTTKNSTKASGHVTPPSALSQPSADE